MLTENIQIQQLE